LEALKVEPTNLYISLCAPDEETYMKVDHPLVKDGWKRDEQEFGVDEEFQL